MKKDSRLDEAILETAKDMWDAGIMDEEEYSRILTRYTHLKKRSNHWVASCPGLDVASQGATEEDGTNTTSHSSDSSPLTGNTTG